MVEFIIKAKEFRKFLDGVSCKGAVQFKAKGKKVDTYLFSSFFVDVDKENQRLNALTLDTYFKKIKQDTSIKANVREEGVFEITDYASFQKIFASMDIEQPIKIKTDDKNIYIETQDGSDWYKRRLIGSKDLDDIFEKRKSLFDWRNQHALVDEEAEDGRTVKVIKFTVPGKGEALYPIRIKAKKEQLKKFVADSLNLTKDNDTIIICKDKVLTIWTGKPNALHQSAHILKYEDIGKKVDDFAIKYSALQAIVPNLLDEVILNFRKQKSGIIVLRIESFDKTMSQVFSIGSQDKDGVLYEEEPSEEEEEDV